MRLRTICYPVRTLGPGERVGIWLSGCDRRCPGCMSPELARSLSQDEQPLEVVCKALTRAFDAGATGVTISGGEPFDQEEELLALLEWLTAHDVRDIICYTGYRLGELQKRPVARRCLEFLAVLVDGPYIAELDDGRGIRGSANQVVYRFDSAYDYDFESVERSQQAFIGPCNVFIVGVR